MNFKNIDKNDETIKINPYSNTIELGMTIGFEGAVSILSFLHEGPKRYKDIKANIIVKKSTLVRQLKKLLMLKMIEKQPIVANGRKTHEYGLTQNGMEFMRFAQKYERRMTIPPSQQKIVEIESNR